MLIIIQMTCKAKQTLHLPLCLKEKTQTEEAEISAEHLRRLFQYLLCSSVKEKEIFVI